MLDNSSNSAILYLMVRAIGDTERVDGATEIRPGVMAGPWESERCKHGRLYSYRWVWAKDGGNIEGSTPEVGRSGCKKCREED